MYVASIADSSDEPKRLRALDRAYDDHFRSIQGREIHRFLTAQAKAHHDRLCDLKKKLVCAFLMMNAEDLTRNPIGSVGFSIHVSSDLERIENAINRGLRHPNTAGHQSEIYTGVFSPERFQDVQRLVKHSNLCGTVGLRSHG